MRCAPGDAIRVGATADRENPARPQVVRARGFEGPHMPRRTGVRPVPGDRAPTYAPIKAMTAAASAPTAASGTAPSQNDATGPNR